VKAYLDPPRMTCAACGSVLLVGRPRVNYAPVECLNKPCPNYAQKFAYQLVEVELNVLPMQPIQ
jgi:hypothetical protein